MENHFKILKTYKKGGSPKLTKDWIGVPRKVRIKIVKEILPEEFLNKMEFLELTDEIFNGHDYLTTEELYKERLEQYLKSYPNFEEFIFESCHWKNVIYDVNFNKELETKDLYRNNFQYLYFAIFGEVFPATSYKIWSKKIENEDKFLSDFVREIKFKKRSKHKPKDIIETVTDIDGNVYKTVKIGNQIWMAENLRVTRFRNGDLIPNVLDDDEWTKLDTSAWCNYDNNPANDDDYGKLYNWYAVNDKRGLAPKGWHVPSEQEWLQLNDFVYCIYDLNKFRLENGQIDVEELLNSIFYRYFEPFEVEYRIGRNNINQTQSFIKKDKFIYWWSKIRESGNEAFFISWVFESCRFEKNTSNLTSGFSIRCIKDETDGALEIVYQNGFCGFRNPKGEMITDYKYDDASGFCEGLARVNLNEKSGFIDNQGNEIIPLVYNSACDFNEGLALVKRNSKWGFIDNQGKEIISFIYDDANSFREGTAIVILNNKMGVIDKQGKVIIPLIYDNASYYREGFAWVELNGKWGTIDKQGKVIIPFIYDNSDSFREGLASVTLNGKWGTIDKQGKEIIPLIYDNVVSFTDGLASVKLNSKWGFIDKQGKVIIPFIYDNSDSFREGLAMVELNGKWGFIDKQGKIIIPFIYDSCWAFRDGLASITIDDKCGSIDKKGNWVRKLTN